MAALLLLLSSATGKECTSPREILAEANFSGLATIRVGAAGNSAFSAASGFVDRRESAPLTLGARYQIASNSKLFVAVGLHQLHEQGVVDLSDPVQAHLGPSDMAAFGYAGQQNYCPVVQGDPTGTCRNITFIQLLSMQSCILGEPRSNYIPYAGTQAAAFGAFVGQPLVCEPGSGAYYYSNPGFILAGYMLEKLSGKLLQDYIAERIAGPLGLGDTYFDPFNGRYDFDPKFVEGSYRFLDHESPNTTLARGWCNTGERGSMGGSGGLASTVDDEAMLYFSLFNFTAGSVGAPLFKSRTTLLALVAPRTSMGSDNYYAQGVVVVVPGGGDPFNVTIPSYITYTGEVNCVSTTNYLRVAAGGSPAVLSQAFSAVEVYYPTSDELRAARTSPKDFYTQVSEWPKATDTNAVAIALEQSYNCSGGAGHR
ncbi:UPF0214 protein YfeW [Diplonema papillatum]|nr:UPF0214 protein YfeW [Diplonema papillatum]